MAIDMEINILRDWSTTSSTNSFRTLSVYFNIFSTIYTKQIQIHTNNSTQTNQIKISKSQEPIVSYIIPKKRENNNANEAITTNSILEPYSIDNNNKNSHQDLESFVISYSINQSVDL